MGQFYPFAKNRKDRQEYEISRYAMAIDQTVIVKKDLARDFA